MGQSHRSFIAIPCPKQIQDVATEIQKELKTTLADVKWVSSEQIHLTLKFLGDVQTDKIDSIMALLQEQLIRFSSFEVELNAVGTFPNAHHPKILWLGLTDPQKTISAMVEILEDKLSSLGFKKETREFHPHMTIGRLRSNKNVRVLSEKLKKISIPLGIKQLVNEVVLFQSTLTSQGPIYTPLGGVKLK